MVTYFLFYANILFFFDMKFQNGDQDHWLSETHIVCLQWGEHRDKGGHFNRNIILHFDGFSPPLNFSTTTPLPLLKKKSFIIAYASPSVKTVYSPPLPRPHRPLDVKLAKFSSRGCSEKQSQSGKGGQKWWWEAGSWFQWHCAKFVTLHILRGLLKDRLRINTSLSD